MNKRTPDPPVRRPNRKRGFFGREKKRESNPADDVPLVDSSLYDVVKHVDLDKQVTGAGHVTTLSRLLSLAVLVTR